MGVLSLSGCTQPENSNAEQEWQAYVQKLIPPAKDMAARRFIELIRIGDFDHARQMAGPPLQGEAAIRQLHNLMYQGELLEVAPIGYNTGTSNYAQQEFHWDDLTYQLHFKGRWYIADVFLDSSPSSDAVLGFHITWHNGFESLAAFHRFTLTGKSWRDWAALILCIGTPIFIITTAAVCAFSPVGRKWLWILFILCGIVQFQYNWSIAILNVQPVSLLLFGGGYRDGVYNPIILQWAIPVGAFTFLICRRKLIEVKTQKSRKPPKKRTSARSA